MEVEVREDVVPPPDSTALLVNNTPPYPMAEGGPVVIVRAEEVLLVVLVLMIWVAAIALFFNRWGKIRMLEPYQPKFQQSHRPSCPLAPLSPPHITPQQRMSFSKYNVNCFADTYSGMPSPNPTRRPRLNSVFVGSSTMAFLNPPRRAKSAMDIQHLVLNETSPTSLTGYRSMLPMINYKDRRPSITIERPQCHAKHRPSISTERPLLSHYQQFRNRRSSCAVDRNRNFSSVDQPKRKASITIERPSCSYQGPTISFETSMDHPTVIVEKAERPKISRSFEQPTIIDKTHLLPRMAASLDVNAVTFDRRPSIPEEDGRCSPVIITLDESEITANAPLLERLKSSDV
ncbi:PREDICTED: uncharacterized protein LOC108561424 isoform X2 [Nicrophorus vespilloides]|nr:PREDICTED: uncharacterized protein LOC108561424 isoform X2 [Nicrophorus vespilloides]XP_017774844.1 PREDICTED: uncharacterized protein LOC108561424 isoform X2 [Nicrophorus vespilloides]